MEEIFSSETLVEFRWTIRRFIPDGRNLFKHRCENFKPYIDQIDVDSEDTLYDARIIQTPALHDIGC
jgi:hypothetical protein